MTYVLAKDYEKIHCAQVTCSSIVKGIEPLLREQGITSQVKLVGSATNGLITYNGKNHTFDFDYNLFVKNAIEWDTAYRAVQSPRNQISSALLGESYNNIHWYGNKKNRVLRNFNSTRFFVCFRQSINDSAHFSALLFYEHCHKDVALMV